MQWKKVIFLLIVISSASRMGWGQAGNATGAAKTTPPKKEEKKKSSAQPPKPAPKAPPKPAVKTPVKPAVKTPVKQEPAPATGPARAEQPSSNDADTSVREFDISCPAAAYKWENGKSKCSDPGYTTLNNAKDIASNLDMAIAGLHVRAIDEKRLLISWKGKKPEHALQELERLIQQEASRNAAADPDENRVIRLYNNRNASKVAEAIKDMFPKIDAGAIGDDVIFLKGQPDDPSKHPFSNIDRMVARMDLPRPQVTIDAWSLQMSSRDPEKLNRNAADVQEQVRKYNSDLETALRNGWKQLIEEWGTGPKGASAKKFRDYVANATLDCAGIDRAKCLQESKFHLNPSVCDTDRYCLGFIDTFDLTTPSLTRLLLLISAADDPKHVGDCVASAMSGPVDPAKNCKAATIESAMIQPRPSFTLFQAELNRLEGPRLGALRAAYSDFLFSYKWSVAYPNDFVPYELSLGASILDSQLEPFMSALNQDVSAHLAAVQSSVQKDLNENKGYSKDELYATGVVSMRAISGLKAEVDTKTASFFNATPPVTVNDIAKNLKDVETNMPAAVQANLGAHAAAALLAGLTAEKPAVARVGRGLTLQATPVSLITASASELDVTLEANEDDSSQVYFKDKDQTKQVDDTSRVSQHKVSTHVRVESMKLFELSSFSASLRRKNRSFPLIPPFVELPYIGSLVRFPLPADPVFHRSFAIVSAIVVPTAADLAFGIPFIGDRKVVAVLGSEPPVVDRCLYEPVPDEKTPQKSVNKAVPKEQKTNAAGHAGTETPAPVTGNAPSKSVRDLCTSNAAGAKGGPQTPPTPEKYIVQRLGSASELRPSVRAYHKKLIGCFKNWQASECDNFTLNDVESEVR